MSELCPDPKDCVLNTAPDGLLIYREQVADIEEQARLSGSSPQVILTLALMRGLDHTRAVVVPDLQRQRKRAATQATKELEERQGWPAPTVGRARATTKRRTAAAASR